MGEVGSSLDDGGRRPDRERSRGWRCSPTSTASSSEPCSRRWRSVSFGEGEWVVRRGDTDVGLYVIVDGEVGVVLDGHELAVLKKGSFFGEISALLGEPAVADVVARSPLRCLYPRRRARRAVPARAPGRDAADAAGRGAPARGRPTSCGPNGCVGTSDVADGLPADRRARDHRRPALDRARRHGRPHRLVLLPALRLAERLRLDPRQGSRRLLPDLAGRPTSGCRSSSTCPTRTSSSRASSPPAASARCRTSCRSRPGSGRTATG